MSPADYTVHCHRCERDLSRLDLPNPAEHPRSTSRMIGGPLYGGLWHCPAHAADCPTCPRGPWTDWHPADPGPYTEAHRHKTRA